MSLVWADGFDHYGTEYDTARFFSSGWEQVSQAPYFEITPAKVRTGNASLWFYNNDTAIKRVLPGDDTMTAGAAFFDPYNSDHINCRWGHWLYNGSHWYGGFIFENGSFAIARDNDILWQSADGAMILNTYNYIEFQLFSHAAEGRLELRRNGQVLQALNNLNTDGGNVTYYQLGGRPYDTPYNTVYGRMIDDLYINNSLGAYNNDFNGDIRCRTFLPDANGPEQDFTVTGAANAFSATNSVPLDTNKYVSGAAIGDKVNFAKPDLPTNTAYICGVNLMVAANKSDAGACEIRPELVGSDGVSVANGTSQTVGAGGIAYYASQFDVDPTTGNLFNQAGFDAALMQIERTA